MSSTYHKYRESFAAGVADIYLEENLVDLLTKVLPVMKRKAILDCIYVYRIVTYQYIYGSIFNISLQSKTSTTES